MKKINLFITDGQYAALTKLVEQNGMSRAEYIRRALDLYFRTEARAALEELKQELLRRKA